MSHTKTPARVEIAQFPGNKRFAVTTSWDDGTIFDRQLVAFMNEVGLKGTFNLNSANLNEANLENTNLDDADLTNARLPRLNAVGPRQRMVATMGARPPQRGIRSYR